MADLLKELVRRGGVEPGPVPREQLEKLGEALGRQFAIWFPNTECPPWGEALMICGTMYGAMKAAGRPIPKPERPKGAPPAEHAEAAPSSAPAAAATSEIPPSPPSFQGELALLEAA